jgi:hypothetical protein
VAGCADPASPRDPTAASPEAAAISASATGTPVRLTFPGESPGPPSYSELAPDFVFHTDRDAAIVFWRTPGCMPGDFNLLQNLTPAYAATCCRRRDSASIRTPLPPAPARR